jgi:hypothetical protein
VKEEVMRRHRSQRTVAGAAVLLGLVLVATGAVTHRAWVGERVVFQDYPLLREIGFQEYRWTPERTEGHCHYSDLAGKPATVVAVDEVNTGQWLVTLELDSSKRRVYSDVFGYTLRDVGFVSEAETARQWVGRTFYNRVFGPGTDNPRNRVYEWRPLDELVQEVEGLPREAEVTLANLEPVELVEVPGWFNSKLAFKLRRANGSFVCWFGQATEINDLDWETFPFHQFRYCWWQGDPLAEHPGWPDAMKQAIRNGDVVPGMDAAMVRLSWGKPKQVSKTGFAKGPDELWVYGEPHLAVVFEDGVVTGFKD